MSPPGRSEAWGRGRAPRVEDVVGPYRLVEALGAGGMGWVFRARHLETGHEVALKVTAALDPEASLRFEREGRALAALRDRHIVQVKELGSDRGWRFLAMELIDGEDLEGLTARGRGPSAGELRIILEELVGALERAHAAGVIHRDLKPGNIMLEVETGRAVLVDFGLARFEDESKGALTASGVVLGTPAFMAPEQIEANPAGIGPHTDVWGLGATTYALLAGRRPFAGDDLVSLFRGMRAGPPELPREAPEWAKQLCAACLRFDPRERPSLAQLRALLRGATRPVRRRGLWVGLALGIGVAAGLWSRGRGTGAEILSVDAPAWRAEPTAVVRLRLSGSGEVAATRVSRGRRVVVRGRADERGLATLSLPLEPGESRWRLASGGETRELNLGYDPDPPAIELEGEALTEDRAEALIVDDRLGLRGMIRDVSPCELRLGGARVPLSGSGHFEITADLLPERAELIVVDAVGHEQRRSVRLILRSTLEGLAWDLGRWRSVGPELRAAFAEDLARRSPELALLGLERFACGGLETEVARFRHLPTGIALHFIPGGEVVLGHEGLASERAAMRALDPSWSASWCDGDWCQERVRIAPFLISQRELRAEEWRALAPDEPVRACPHGAAMAVSWVAAQRLCRRGGLRLPTEQEWEHAYRAGGRLRYFWGETFEAERDRPWTGGLRSTFDLGAGPATAPNAFGLFDMAAHLREWCDGEADGTQRPIRGASLDDKPGFMRGATRSFMSADGGQPGFGLRLAIDYPASDG